jgi:AraC-like DNA-binding protein
LALALMVVCSMEQSCSARLIQPFIRFASAKADHRELVPTDFWTAHSDSRISLEAARLMLDRGVEFTKDESLGLKIGRTMRFGSGGAFDYVIRSSENVAQAVRVASKYSRILADDFNVTYETWRSRFVVRLDGAWSRATADFAMSSMYSIHFSELASAELEVWFPYTRPSFAMDYDTAFPGASVRFGASCYGITLSQRASEAPLPGSNGDVHELLLARVERMLEELSAHKPVVHAVRRLICQEMQQGGTTLDGAAHALRMSQRTLCRRLEREGTSFNGLVDDVRKERALELLRDPKVPLTEMAFLLGFSHVESFHRAFKRWTGTTPHLHRNAMQNA